ncbi:MAG: NEAT domain-containing protein [Ruminococcus sp.]|nr:NEAT domain-containing protein [Ruminococcus sp.]
MKKTVSIMMAICVLMFSCACGVFAVSLEEGQLYEVPITLIHAEKDKTSMGDKYIYNTALIEVKGGKKYLTMVTDSEVSNLNFWYYNDGSVEGDTTDAEHVNDVEISGKTYSVGYRFPLCGEEQLVGVKFSASIMPMKPSARVKIDYDNAKAVSSAPKQESTEPSSEAATTEVTTAASAQTTAADTTSQTVPAETTAPQTQPVTQETYSQTTQPASAAAIASAPVDASAQGSSTIEVSINYPTLVVVMQLAILVLAVIFIILVCKGGKKDND